MLSHRMPGLSGQKCSQRLSKDSTCASRAAGVSRRARTSTVWRCSLGPLSSGNDQSGQSGEQPKRVPHPEMDESSVQGSAEASVIPDTLPYLGSQSDWREFRAKLVSQSRGGGADPDSDPGEWAHIISKPEKGALLLAHPLLFQRSQTYFHRSAILLLEHGDMGSYGVILNRPSHLLIRDVPLSRPHDQFGDCRLYVGGDVGNGEVQIIHPYGQLSGTTEVVKGVYLGGLDGGRDAVDAGFAQAKSFRWFNGYAGWAPGQLLMECKRGVWFTAAASPKVILQDVEPGEGPQYWHKIMRMLGGDYEELSRSVQKHDELTDSS